MDICDATDVFKIIIKKYLPDKGDTASGTLDVPTTGCDDLT